MNKKEFEIGQDFYTATGKWRCTDIGTRVIVAIHLHQEDLKNYGGPPYSIPENVFDEYDMEGCSLDPSEFEEKKDQLNFSPRQALRSFPPGHPLVLFLGDQNTGPRFVRYSGPQFFPLHTLVKKQKGQSSKGRQGGPELGICIPRFSADCPAERVHNIL